MSIDLSHPGLDIRRKKKLILARLHLFNWLKASELGSEWVWASIESEKDLQSFIRWISKQPIKYPIEVRLFNSQWHEISNFLALNEFDLANVFKTTRATYIISNDLQWIIERSNIDTARFGTMNV